MAYSLKKEAERKKDWWVATGFVPDAGRALQ